MRKIAGFMAAVIVIASSAQIRAEGLDALIEVGKSMADINAATAEETRVFNAVKAAIDRGIIKKGLSMAAIRKQYGEPVIINEDSATKREKWGYKPDTSSFLKGVRVYLYFDKNGILDEIRVVK